MSDELQHWVARQLGRQPQQLQWQPLSGDAGFRRYYRCRCGNDSWMAVLAPPASENNPAFVQIAGLLADAGVNVPAVLAVDYQHGFMLQNDLGDRLLLPQLTAATADDYYHKAMQQLQLMQGITADRLQSLPRYDEPALRLELSYFSDWFVSRLLGIDLQAHEQQLLVSLFDWLVDSALQQPQVFVHRDYHSRNIMLTASGELATIDFQDAVLGPASYDLVSLLRDCYVVWPAADVSRWVEQFRASTWPQLDAEQFRRGFDLIGLQRHIKVLGVFARLSIRDNKHGYLNDLPTVIRYVRDVAAMYPQAAEFLDWFDQRLMPQARLQPWGKAL